MGMCLNILVLLVRLGDLGVETLKIKLLGQKVRLILIRSSRFRFRCVKISVFYEFCHRYSMPSIKSNEHGLVAT